jgi:hypothetical protein
VMSPRHALWRAGPLVAPRSEGQQWERLVSKSGFLPDVVHDRRHQLRGSCVSTCSRNTAESLLDFGESSRDDEGTGCPDRVPHQVSIRGKLVSRAST